MGARQSGNYSRRRRWSFGPLWAGSSLADQLTEHVPPGLPAVPHSLELGYLLLAQPEGTGGAALSWREGRAAYLPALHLASCLCQPADRCHPA